MNEPVTAGWQTLNSSLELGLRSLFILEAITPQFRDLQRLVYYDYLLVHSGDIDDNMCSLHPSLPHRSGEQLVHRPLLFAGLEMMFAKELLEKRFDAEEGITYGANDLTAPFLSYFECQYAGDLRSRAAWLADSFERYSDHQLQQFMTDHLGVWGAEFKLESVVRGLPL